MGSSADHSRYQRQSILPQIGTQGQERLLAAHAIIVGCGALGCVSADLLARAGVGTLTIIDRDVVERTNLQRQPLFDEAAARSGAPKAEAAVERLRRINSGIRVHGMVADVSASSAERLLLGPDRPPAGVLVDGTDNFGTRYLLNDVAVKHGVPYVYGGAVGVRAMHAVFLPGGPCLRCVFPDPPPAASAPTCDTAGIIGAASAMAAAAQAVEAIKVLIGRQDQCSRSLVDFDVWTGVRREIALPTAPSADCPCCALGRFDSLSGADQSDATVICTRTDGGAVQIAAPVIGPGAVNLPLLAERLRPHGDFVLGDRVLSGTLRDPSPDSMHPVRVLVFADGRTIVRGTADPAFARSIHARYIGA